MYGRINSVVGRIQCPAYRDSRDAHGRSKGSGWSGFGRTSFCQSAHAQNYKSRTSLARGATPEKAWLAGLVSSESLDVSFFRRRRFLVRDSSFFKS